MHSKYSQYPHQIGITQNTKAGDTLEAVLQQTKQIVNSEAVKLVITDRNQTSNVLKNFVDMFLNRL